MKSYRNLFVGAMCLSLLVPTGCQTFQNMNKTGQNAIVGGAAGGAVGTGIGALLGGGKGAWIGALIGSAIGAGAGAAIGHQMDKQKAELENELASLQNQVNQQQQEIKVEEVKDSNNLKAIKVVLGDAILFNTGSSTLSPAADAALSKIAYNMKQNPGSVMTIVGFTDNTGTYEQNMQLSLKRAQAVMNYLTSQGVAASRLKAMGEGWNNPVTSNSTAAGRAQNRRVELYITAGEQMIKEAQSGY
ncbi:MAG: OmpA family protein [Bacteroidales bacterium]